MALDGLFYLSLGEGWVNIYNKTMLKTRSPQFIREMKGLIEAEKAKLGQELAKTEDFPEYGRDEEDNATEIADYTATQATREAKEARLRELNAALARIETGTYGLDSNGKLIPEERLRANPAATAPVA